MDAILELRRTEKWGNARIAAHLADSEIEVSASTVQRTLIARTPAKGRFVIPEPIDDAVEITEAQMSIFDLLG